MPGSLAVLVQQRTDEPQGWALPGRFLREKETIADTIRFTLREKVGLEAGDVEPRLIQVFDSPERDPRAWTLSLAHALVLPPEQAERGRGRLAPIDAYGALVEFETLHFDHDEIVRTAAEGIRQRYELDPDPDRLLGRAFSLADLKRTHEAVLGEMLQRDTFRRRMAPRLMPALDEDGQQSTRIDGGRPARLWSGTTDQMTDDTTRRLRLPRA